jgi:hypothetical protein
LAVIGPDGSAARAGEDTTARLATIASTTATTNGRERSLISVDLIAINPPRGGAEGRGHRAGSFEKSLSLDIC